LLQAATLLMLQASALQARLAVAMKTAPLKMQNSQQAGLPAAASNSCNRWSTRQAHPTAVSGHQLLQRQQLR
jgi:hypothetical protein